MYRNSSEPILTHENMSKHLQNRPNTSQNVRKRSKITKNYENVRKFPEASERVRSHWNASECIRTCPNMSKRVRKLPRRHEMLTFGSTPGRRQRRVPAFRTFVLYFSFTPKVVHSGRITAFKVPFKAAVKGHAAGQASTRMLALGSERNFANTLFGRFRTFRFSAPNIFSAKI